LIPVDNKKKGLIEFFKAVYQESTVALPPSRFIKPGTYTISVDNVQVGSVSSWKASGDDPPKSLQKTIQLITDELGITMEAFFKQAMPSFCACLVDGGRLDREHPLFRWIQTQTAHFQELRSLCRQLLEEDPDCFTSLEKYACTWPSVRGRLIFEYNMAGAYREDAYNFAELLAEAAVVLLWRSGAWTRPEDVLEVREDPKKFVIKPDQVQIDSVEEEQEINLSTVPLVPLDLDDD
jgi:hypothetical protein